MEIGRLKQRTLVDAQNAAKDLAQIAETDFNGTNSILATLMREEKT